MLPNPELFLPFDLGSLRLPNRLVMAPMTRNRAGDGNVPTPRNALYYAQRASAGLIITEATQVSPDGVGYPATPGIHSPQQVDGWRRVVDNVHAAGGRIFLQLWHVGRISHPSLQPRGTAPVAPSAIRPEGNAMTLDGEKPFETPRALALDEIPRFVGQFAAGARNALQAGFDGVEIHAANGYLIDQFLRDGTNRREDDYGGSIENRGRFLEEVTDAVCEVWPADRVGVRLSPTSSFNDMRDSSPQETFAHAATVLGRRGLAYMHVIESGDDGESQTLTRHLREAFGGTTIVNDGYDAERAAAAIRERRAELVALGVPFIGNPDLVTRLALGAELAEGDRESFYGGDANGYTTYPMLTDVEPR